MRPILAAMLLMLVVLSSAWVGALGSWRRLALLLGLGALLGLVGLLPVWRRRLPGGLASALALGLLLMLAAPACPTPPADRHQLAAWAIFLTLTLGAYVLLLGAGYFYFRRDRRDRSAPLGAADLYLGNGALLLFACLLAVRFPLEGGWPGGLLPSLATALTPLAMALGALAGWRLVAVGRGWAWLLALTLTLGVAAAGGLGLSRGVLAGRALDRAARYEAEGFERLAAEERARARQLNRRLQWPGLPGASDVPEAGRFFLDL